MEPKIDHIGIAVNSIEEAFKLYKDLLHIEKSTEEILQDRGIKVTFLYIKDVRIELMEPMREDSEISNFLKKRGEGFHHIAYQVDNIRNVLENAKKMGYKTLSDEPNRGAGGSLVFFLHPKSANGILTEFVEYQK
ncbi:MAG: methylmalonyl-CoA/ethylmalonyl-CoA epimerase [Petrotoga sp.]|jgi:methylmalonyl-CoA/ethylmalonyl-CoA epimerase|nr:methylmalonyl-CoA/ethylmalonyl-CoA epimerase [Petrotoga sp.]MDK2906786.1 methylmalonyl-CoA/ethylmalonyl-CoA epimerase [Petrotoga sp.]